MVQMASALFMLFVSGRVISGTHTKEGGYCQLTHATVPGERGIYNDLIFFFMNMLVDMICHLAYMHM